MSGAIDTPTAPSATTTDTSNDAPAKGKKKKSPDGDSLQEIPEDRLPEHLREEESGENGISNPSTFDQATSWMKGIADSAKQKTRNFHNRSAKHEAKRSSKSAERVAAEVSGAATAVVKTSLSNLLGGLVGTAKGLFYGVSPTSLKRLRMEKPGELTQIGTWVASDTVERDGVPIGLLQFDWSHDEAQTHFEEVIALTDATNTRLELPDGSVEDVVAIPIDSDGSGDTDEGQPLGFIVAVDREDRREVYLFRDE